MSLENVASCGPSGLSSSFFLVTAQTHDVQTYHSCRGTKGGGLFLLLARSDYSGLTHDAYFKVLEQRAGDGSQRKQKEFTVSVKGSSVSNRGQSIQVLNVLKTQSGKYSV